MDAVVRWANDPDTTGGRDGFAERWYRAICTRAYLLIEEALEIVDDDSGDFKTITTKGGGEKVVIDHDNIQRAKLKYEARKWIATRFAPRVFGDHKIVQHNHSGAVGLQRLPDTELDQRLESLTQQLHQKQPIEHQE